jgi:hypothetical protein
MGILKMERQSIISEKTLVPLGAIALIFGAAMWLTSIWRQGEANTARIQEVKQDQARDIDKVYTELNRISEKLDHLIEKK